MKHERHTTSVGADGDPTSLGLRVSFTVGDLSFLLLFVRPVKADHVVHDHALVAVHVHRHAAVFSGTNLPDEFGVAHRCRAHQRCGRVEHLAQGLGSEVIDEQENETQPCDDEGGRGAQISFLIADHDSAHDEREDGSRSSEDQVRCHRCRLWRADLGGMLREGRTVAVGPIRIGGVPGLRARGRENPVVRIVGRHERALLEEPTVDAVTALLLLRLKVLSRHGLVAHLVEPGRHASRGSHRQDDQADDRDAQPGRVAHGCNHAEAGDAEA